MSIKNNGGIFGRNPTFNNVDVEGVITSAGDISTDGDINADAINEQTSGSGVTIDGVLLKDNKIAKAGLPAGCVLQVATGETDGTQISSNSSTYVSTGLSASITPLSASSTILVIVTHNGLIKNDSDTGAQVLLLRDGTQIYTTTVSMMRNFTSTSFAQSAPVAMMRLDSPNTTSEITYSTELRRSAGTGTVYLDGNGEMSTMTLIEVAG